MNERRSKKSNFRQFFRKYMTAQKFVYIPMELILNNILCLPHVSSVYKKVSPKTFGPTALCKNAYCIASLGLPATVTMLMPYIF